MGVSTCTHFVGVRASAIIYYSTDVCTKVAVRTDRFGLRTQNQAFLCGLHALPHTEFTHPGAGYVSPSSTTRLYAPAPAPAARSCSRPFLVTLMSLVSSLVCATLPRKTQLSPPSANPTTVIEDVAVQPDTAYAEEGRLPTKMLSVPYPNTKVDPGAGNDGRDKERKARLASPAAKLPPSRWARREIQTQTDDGLIGSGGRGSGGGGSSSASPSPRRQSRKRKTDEYVQDDEGKDASAPAGEGEGGKEMEVDGRKPTAVGTQMSPAAVVGMAGVADDVESTGISPHRNKRARTNSEVLLDQQLKQGRGNDADGGHAANDGRKQDTRRSIDRDGKDKSSAEVTTGGDGDKKNDDGDLAASETPKRPNDSSADGAERRREAHGTDRHLGGKSPYVRGDGGMKPRPYRSAAAGGVRFTDSEAQQAPTKVR